MATTKFQVLTRSDVENWVATGKQKVFDVIDMAGSCEDSVVLLDSFERLSLAMSELIAHSVGGHFKLAQILECLQDLKTHFQLFFDDALCDSIWLSHISLDSNVENTSSITNQKQAHATSIEQMNRFCQFVEECKNKGIISRVALMETLDTDLFEPAKIMTSVRDFVLRQTRLNTSNLYAQRKFNLLREESEGYSKLITELNKDINPSTVNVAVEQVTSLIGHFSLDPNRVMDILVECGEQHPFNSSYFELVRQISTPSLSQVVGFRLRYTQRNENEHPNENFYIVVAQLISFGLFSIEDIYPHLTPKDEELKESYSKYVLTIQSLEKECESMASREKVMPFDVTRPYDNANQKYRLVSAFFSICDTNNGLRMLDILADSFPCTLR